VSGGRSGKETGPEMVIRYIESINPPLGSVVQKRLKRKQPPHDRITGEDTCSAKIVTGCAMEEVCKSTQVGAPLDFCRWTSTSLQRYSLFSSLGLAMYSINFPCT
jgi:hypothetical protein